MQGCINNMISLFVRLEIRFSRPALRADPVVGNIFKRSARRDAAVFVSDFGVIDIIAYGTDILLHATAPLALCIIITQQRASERSSQGI